VPLPEQKKDALVEFHCSAVQREVKFIAAPAEMPAPRAWW